MSVVVLVGNPKPRSRTYAAAHLVAEKLTGAQADHSIDLADLGAGLFDPEDQRVAEAIAAVEGASLLVVASPTYKASYTGLLKPVLVELGATVPVKGLFLLDSDYAASEELESWLPAARSQVTATLNTERARVTS
ncbi:NAD(P)H-dependent oxidoreductase [Streptacidiphilus sp. EB103A]|uniref:NAD(P)H-dependent oxidoreductase n=1 Tax=Streptacidiphilus sp. EB103A TaxID=3156275 RepID=UPI003512EBB6